MGVGARMVHASWLDPSCPRSSAPSSASLAPAFTELEEIAEATLYVDGAARLLSEERVGDLSR